MVTSSAASLQIRDGLPHDVYAIAAVLSSATVNSPLHGRPDAETRIRCHAALCHFSVMVEEALTSGVVRVVEDAGEIVGAAVWSLRSHAGPPCVLRQSAADLDASSLHVPRRTSVFDDVALRRCPPTPHHQLLHIGVRPGWQRQGIGGYLLISLSPLPED